MDSPIPDKLVLNTEKLRNKLVELYAEERELKSKLDQLEADIYLLETALTHQYFSLLR